MPLFRRNRGGNDNVPVSALTAIPRRKRTTAYPEVMVNMVAFYVSYLLLVASSVLIFIFAWRAPSVSVQIFDVQPQPSVIFAWNADPRATNVPVVSETSSEGGGSATCTPDTWRRGTRLEYDCTSIAADGLEKLRFSLTTSIPFPPTSSSYIPSTQRYKDLAVPTYYVRYYTYLAPKTASAVVPVATSTSAGSQQGSIPAATSPGANRARELSPEVATATLAADLLQPRQASATSAPVPTVSPTLPLSLVSIQYAGSSLSALIAGTIVSTFPTPSATTTSIPVQSAKLKDSFLIYSTVIAALPLLAATLTVILVSYNVSVASRKVWPSVQGHDQDRGQVLMRERSDRSDRRAHSITAPAPASMPLRIYNDFMNMATLWADKGPLSPWTPTAVPHAGMVPTLAGETPIKEPSLPPPSYEQSRTNRLSATVSRPRRPSVSGQAQSDPPAYNEQPALLVSRNRAPLQAHTEDREDDDIEVAPSISTPSISDDESHYAGPVGHLSHPDNRVARYVPAAEIVPPKTRSDGTRLPLRLAWMILPTYGFIFLWDLLVYFVLPIPEIVAFSLAANAFSSLQAFVATGGCLGEPAEKDSVYDLQRYLCGRRFLSSYPQAYSNASPPTTLMLFGRDSLILLVGLALLFVAHLAWFIVLVRKSHLAERDGMEPFDHDGGRRMTGRTRWRYVTAFNKVGGHGWLYDQVAEAHENQQRREGEEYRLAVIAPPGSSLLSCRR